MAPSRFSSRFPHSFDRRTALRGTLAMRHRCRTRARSAVGGRAGVLLVAHPEPGATGADVTELQIRVAGWAADSASQTRVAIDGNFGAGDRGGGPPVPGGLRTHR